MERLSLSYHHADVQSGHGKRNVGMLQRSFAHVSYKQFDQLVQVLIHVFHFFAYLYFQFFYFEYKKSTASHTSCGAFGLT